MPNRIIREGILDSERMDKLSWQGECFYRRLHSIVDDYGCFDARLSILKSKLYPTEKKQAIVSLPDVGKWLTECVNADLVRCYVVADKPYLVVLDFNQTVRIKKRKFPAPPENATHTHSTRMSETNPNQSETNPDLNPKRNEDAQFGNQVFYDLKTLEKKLLEDQGWIEISAKNLRAEISEITEAIPAFLTHLKAHDTHEKSLKDAKQHFNNWYPKRKAKKNEQSNSDSGGKIGRTKVSAIQEFMQQPIINQNFNGNSET